MNCIAVDKYSLFSMICGQFNEFNTNYFVSLLEILPMVIVTTSQVNIVSLN